MRNVGSAVRFVWALTLLLTWSVVMLLMWEFDPGRTFPLCVSVCWSAAAAAALSTDRCLFLLLFLSEPTRWWRRNFYGPEVQTKANVGSEALFKLQTCFIGDQNNLYLFDYYKTEQNNHYKNWIIATSSANSLHSLNYDFHTLLIDFYGQWRPNNLTTWEAVFETLSCFLFDFEIRDMIIFIS